MSGGSSTLSRPVRMRALARHGGQLLLVSALLAAVPALVAVPLGDWRFAAVQALVAATMALSGALLARVRADAGLQRNEALALIALIFILTPAAGSLALQASGMAPVDAFFEAVSGVTTTGLSMLSDPQAHSGAVLFARAWMQWYGGLGVIVLTIALIGGQHAASKRLYAAVETQTIEYSTRSFARHMLLAYLGLSALCWLVLTLASGAAFNALLHTLAAVSTGGFSPFAGSLLALPDWSMRYLVILFSLCGALPLAVIVVSGLRHSGRDIEIKALLAVCAVLAGLLGWRMYANLQLEWGEALLQGGLLAISAQSTTGFSVLSVGLLDDASKLMICVAMLIGGCLGSTAGGIKLLRVLMIGRVLQLQFLGTSLPDRAMLPQRLGNLALKDEDVQQALLLMVLMLGALLFSWLVFLGYGYDAIDALFEVSSALATTGLSSGITADSMPDELKLLLCFDMLLGRVELFALLVLLYPRTWLRQG